MKTLREMISVMQACEDGKKIEVSCYMLDKETERWIDDVSPVWEWARYQYRIKSEPLIIYASVSTDGHNTVFDASAYKENLNTAIADRKIIKLQEIE